MTTIDEKGVRARELVAHWNQVNLAPQDQRRADGIIDGIEAAIRIYEDRPAHWSLADDPPGWLLDQTYGHTDPPEHWTTIQRDDETGMFPGDLDAAVAYSQAHGCYVVMAIGDAETRMLAPQSDVMVRSDGHGPAHTDHVDVVWVTEELATRYGWYANPDR